MKYLITAILFFIPIQAFSYVLIGTIEDENNNPYPKLEVLVKDKDTGLVFCDGQTNDTGIVRIECELQQDQEYRLDIKKDNKYLTHTYFETNEPILTIGKNGYNHIRIGLYSQNNSISLFSEEYEEIQEKLFEHHHYHTPGEDHHAEEDNDSTILFKCEDPLRQAAFIYYQYYKDDTPFEEGITDRVMTFFEPWDYIEYNDWENKRKVIINPIYKNLLLGVENCNEENSRESLGVVSIGSSRYTEEELNELSTNIEDGYKYIEKEETTITPIEKTDEYKDKKNTIYGSVTKINEPIEERSFLILYIIIITCGMLIAFILWLLYFKKKK